MAAPYLRVIPWGATISLRGRSLFFSSSGGLHRDEGATAGGGVEGDLAVGLGEQGMVLADADIGAGMELGAALADQHVARDHELIAEPLHAQALAGGIAAVARAAACFLMCHDFVLLKAAPLGGLDVGDLERRQLLTMAALAAIVVAAMLLEDDDL